MANIFQRATRWMADVFRGDAVPQAQAMPLLPPGTVGPDPDQANAPVAPWPLVDRFPTVIGSNLSFQHISAILRQCTTGYRREYVDLLDELLEREPHGFAVLSKRILQVAGSRLEITPHELPDDDPQRDLAHEIADFVRRAIDGIADLEQSLAQLQWGIYTGISAAETGWALDNGKWVPKRLHFVHSRRLAYPDPSSWKVRIWDQGAVRSWWDAAEQKTSQVFGLVVDDLPGKFIVHTPQLRGSYPTRDGLGRELVWWFALKGMAARGAGQYIERFAKPWPIVSYSTTSEGTPRLATDQDIAAAHSTAAAFGIGAASSVVLPDSIKTDIIGPGVANARSLSHVQFIELINGEISKCVLGETLTTESGAHGNRAAAEVHKQGSTEIARYDATCLSATLKRDLVWWIVKLNYPQHTDLCPSIAIHVEEKPDPKGVIEVAAAAAAVGMPINADKLAEQLGLPLIEQEKPEDAPPDWKPKPRRLAPLKPVDISQLDKSFEPGSPGCMMGVGGGAGGSSRLQGAEQPLVDPT